MPRLRSGMSGMYLTTWGPKETTEHHFELLQFIKISAKSTDLSHHCFTLIFRVFFNPALCRSIIFVSFKQHE